MEENLDLLIHGKYPTFVTWENMDMKVILAKVFHLYRYTDCIVIFFNCSHSALIGKKLEVCFREMKHFRWEFYESWKVNNKSLKRNLSSLFCYDSVFNCLVCIECSDSFQAMGMQCIVHNLLWNILRILLSDIPNILNSMLFWSFMIGKSYSYESVGRLNGTGHHDDIKLE